MKRVILTLAVVLGLAALTFSTVGCGSGSSTTKTTKTT